MGSNSLNMHCKLDECSIGLELKVDLMERQHILGDSQQIISTNNEVSNLENPDGQLHGQDASLLQHSKTSGPATFVDVEGKQNHSHQEPNLTIKAQESTSIFMFSSAQSDNPSKTRSWKREARERHHRSPHPSPSSGQIKRKEEQFQTIVTEQLEGLKRVKGTNDVGDAVILSAGTAMQARQSS
ncbi:hypothetical protein SLE2022_117250 [Rubroshorea leprosula]